MKEIYNVVIKLITYIFLLFLLNFLMDCKRDIIKNN